MKIKTESEWRDELNENPEYPNEKINMLYGDYLWEFNRDFFDWSYKQICSHRILKDLMGDK